jgi:photosystem II stability/assembly factor-like uncharacterized protein
MKQCASFLALMLVGVSLALAQSPAGTHPKKLTAAAQSDSKPKFKAIWEPVNYKEDLYLSDVFFVSKEEGWVSGAAGTILHTKDGGNSWAAQLGGDPHAEGVELTNLFFADATHGWAQASTSLFRTTDGESWEHVTGDIRGKLFFVSDTKGFRVYGPTLFATTDGGENWKEIFTCRAKMEVQGLTQESECNLGSIQFPSASVGYAVGEARVVAKTQDGGDTWTVLVGPEEPGDQRAWNLFFLDASTGYEIRSNGALKRTTDGGQTWKGVIAQLDPTTATNIKFADQEIGWSIRGTTWAYTVDGGNHWTTRQVHLPAGVLSFSLPTRDRGYVVGGHGMIYRYRIVPIDYTSKGMLEAPMMPAGSARQSSSN